jgi:hypothetical protein
VRIKNWILAIAAAALLTVATAGAALAAVQLTVAAYTRACVCCLSRS